MTFTLKCVNVNVVNAVFMVWYEEKIWNLGEILILVARCLFTLTAIFLFNG